MKDIKFNVEIYLKNGNILKFPKGYFSEFIVKQSNNKIIAINWITTNKGQVLALDLNEIVAIITHK